MNRKTICNLTQKPPAKRVASNPYVYLHPKERAREGPENVAKKLI
jgi:hypothetical protein